jgi:hypothetical protein
MTFLEADESQESVSFAETVSPGSNGRLSHELQRDATIEWVMVRVYPGPQNDLEIRPQIKRGSGDGSTLIQYEGKGYVDGDDDEWPFPVNKQAREGDDLIVKYDNKDPNNSYDFRVIIAADFRGGTDSLIGNLFGRM